MNHTDNWKHRRLITYICVLASIAMAIGLFLIPTDKSAVISGAVVTITLALLGLSGSYSGIATIDDHSKRTTGKD